MNCKIKEPTQPISPVAIKLWRVTDGITITVFFCILISFYLLKNHYEWGNWVSIVLYIFSLILFISAIFEIIIIPVYKQKTWRYEIDKEYIQIKYGGFLKTTYMIIPMEKVYYVNSTQGLIAKKFGLSTIKIGTIAYIHEIPGIPVQKANELRELIAIYSGTKLNHKA